MQCIFSKLHKQPSHIAIAKNAEKNIHFKNVIFRPIFVDSNKKKIAYDYKNIYWINPKLRDQKIAILYSYKKVKSYQPKKMSYTAHESMKVKVCEK